MGAGGSSWDIDADTLRNDNAPVFQARYPGGAFGSYLKPSFSVTW